MPVSNQLNRLLQPHPAMPPAANAANDTTQRPALTLATLVKSTTAGEVDKLRVPADTPLKNLEFLTASPQSGGMIDYSRSELCGALLNNVWASPDATDLNNLMGVRFLEHEFKVASFNRVYKELHDSKVFLKRYSSYPDFAKDVPNIIKKVVTPANLMTRASDWEATEPVAKSAATGSGANRIAAYACPPTLEPLAKVWIGKLLIHGKDLPAPGGILARLTILSGQKSRHAQDRLREDSDLCLMAETLTGICRKGQVDASATLVGSQIPEVLRDMGGLLPPALLSARLSRDVLFCELNDSHAYATGDATTRYAIEVRRLTNAGHAYSNLRTYFQLFPGTSEAAVGVGRLVSTLCPNMATARFEVQLEALELELSMRHDLTTRLVNAAKGKMTGEELTHAIIAENKLARGSGANSGSGGDSATIGADTDVSMGDAFLPLAGRLKDEVIGIALRAPEFLDACQSVKTQKLSDREVCEEYLLSGSTLMIRAVLHGESWLLSRSEGLAILSTARTGLASHFERAITLDTQTDCVPLRLEKLVYPISEIKLMSKGLFHKLQFQNKPAGFLQVVELRSGGTYAVIAEEHLWRNEASVRGARGHGRRIFGCINFATDECDTGYTFSDLADEHLEVLAFSDTLPTRDQEEWQSWAVESLLEALKRAGELFTAKVFSTDPGSKESRISEFLKWDDPYFRNVKNRMKQAEPIAEMRAAFPTLLSGGLITLAGIPRNTNSPPPPAQGASGANKRKPDTKKAHREAKDPKAANRPGSQANFCKTLPSGKLFIAGMVIDTQTIADHFKVKMTDKCWPVLLSKKEGEGRLSLCPDHASHGGVDSLCHVRPKGFSLQKVYEKNGRKATPEEAKDAGWREAKKVKP